MATNGASPGSKSAPKVQMYLSVPFAQKDEAKQLGARWDAASKKWYVPHGVDINPFQAWWPADLQDAPVVSAVAPAARKPSRPATPKTTEPATGFTSRSQAVIVEYPDDDPPWEE